MWKVGIGIVVVVVGACASDSSKEPRIAGFNPPNPGKNGVQLITPPIRDIPAGADENYCTYLDFKADSDLDIYDYKGYQSAVGGHHTVLYAVRNNEPVDTHICNEADMVNAQYVAGGGADSPGVTLPDGIVFRLPVDRQLMVQSHWINATDHAIDGQVAFNLSVETPSPDHVRADMFANANTMFTLTPGVASATASCVFPKDMSFFYMEGHAHQWATHITMTLTPAGGATQMIYDTPWSKEYQFNGPANQFTKDAPFTIHAGDRLDVNCTYNNDTGAMMAFPQEMCVGFGYFFPADHEVDCVDGEWPTN